MAFRLQRSAVVGHRQGYVTLDRAIVLASTALAGAAEKPAGEEHFAAGRAVLRQLLIGGAVEAIVVPRRRKARVVPAALWSTNYADTMFDTGAAEFSDGAGASAGMIEGGVLVPQRVLAAALREEAWRASSIGRVGRIQILSAFEGLCRARLVSFERGGLARAAEALRWSFPSHKVATIAGIIRHAYAAHRDGQKGGAGSRPRTKKTKRRTRR